MFQHGQQALAVDHPIGGQLDAGDLQDRGKEVDAAGRHVGGALRLDHAGPANDQWHANAAFVGKPFAGTQRGVVGRSQQPAVVRGEDDHRVLGKTQLVQHGHDPARGIVDTLDHGRINGVLLVRARLGTIFLDQISLGLDRRMHGIVAQIQEERLVAVGPDERDRLVRFPIGQVLAFSTRRQVGDLVELPLRPIGVEVARRLSQIAPAMVDMVALHLGEVRPLAQVPLADMATNISGRPKRLGQGQLVSPHEQRIAGTEQFILRPAHILGHILAGLGHNAALEPATDPIGNSHASRIASGLHGRPGRRTDGTRRIPVGKSHPPGSQPVDLRRLEIPAPLACQIGPSQVVDQDQYDVGAVVSFCSTHLQNGCYEQRSPNGDKGARSYSA